MSSETLATLAYEKIHQQIVEGGFAPGEKLQLRRLATIVGPGATPLRQALSRLASEGWVIGHPQRGYWVAPISKEEFEQITDLRMDLEPKAFRQSIRKGDFSWESRVVAAFYGLSKVTKLLMEGAATPAQWEVQNRGFHMTLIESCGNPWLLRFNNVLYDHSDRYRRLTVQAFAVPPDTSHAEHEALMRAAVEHDEEAGVKLLQGHIRGSAEGAMKTIFSTPTSVPSGSKRRLDQ